MNNKKSELLFPNIHEYLEKTQNSYPISAKNLEFLIAAISAKTNLSKNAAKIITIAFFEEIRNNLINGIDTVLEDFGTFQLRSPKTSKKNTRKIQVRFKSSLKLKRKLKHEQ